MYMQYLELPSIEKVPKYFKLDVNSATPTAEMICNS